MPSIIPSIVQRETRRHLIADVLHIDVWNVNQDHFMLMRFCNEHGLKPEAAKMMNDIAIQQNIPVMQIVMAFDDYWSNPETI